METINLILILRERKNKAFILPSSVIHQAVLGFCVCVSFTVRLFGGCHEYHCVSCPTFPIWLAVVTGPLAVSDVYTCEK
jgi:hypothetical protein